MVGQALQSVQSQAVSLVISRERKPTKNNQ
jgi:hypothetical protein